MHDIVIRGGTIVDGTGKAAFAGDVAIEGDRIAAVGGKVGPARREIDAAGLLVTPGWVDVHTHYDGQAMWDPLLAPSCWHGVTTVMFGNCGVGFAPVKKHHHGALMDLMEGVEEIPNPVLSAGLTWEWETFPQFMDALERRPHAIDIAAQAAHLPLRVYVMGDRAVRREPATADDIAEMRRLTIEALEVGAFGFTTSRTDLHKTPDGDLVPSRNADADELLGIGSALGAVGGGAFGMNSDFDDEAYELAWLKRLARETKRPVWFLLTDRHDDPERWRRLMKARARSACRGPADDRADRRPADRRRHDGHRRDRRRGPRLPLEFLVKRQTSETADFFELADRGRLAPGLRADVNLIDFGGLRPAMPELVHDMPAGGRRFVQRVDGYVATLVAGQPIFERGEHTGAMPGRLVRARSNGAH